MLLRHVPSQWKPVITGAVTTGACAAMNYAINRIRELVGDPGEPEIEVKDDADT